MFFLNKAFDSNGAKHPTIDIRNCFISVCLPLIEALLFTVLTGRYNVLLSTSNSWLFSQTGECPLKSIYVIFTHKTQFAYLFRSKIIGFKSFWA
jgi:hypothetical protein